MLVDPFFHGGFLHLGLNMFSFYILGSDFENQVGTLGAAYTVLLIVIPFSGVTHTILSYVFDGLSGMSTRSNCASPCAHHLQPTWNWSFSCISPSRAGCLFGTPILTWQDHFFCGFSCCLAVGISGVLFALIVLALEMSPSDAISFFGLFSLPKKFYPWFLLAVLSLLSPGLSFMGHLAGIVIGYGIFYNVFGLLLPPDAKVEELETRLGLKSLPLYRGNPICNGNAALDMFSRQELPTGTGNPSDGSTGHSQISQWFQVLKAWFTGLNPSLSREPFLGEGQRLDGAATRSGVPLSSRLLQAKAPSPADAEDRSSAHTAQPARASGEARIATDDEDASNWMFAQMPSICIQENYHANQY
jgi:membrane associated rhomboid family serine protease